MARKSRRRYYRRKGRWSANITEFTSQTTIATGNFYISNSLAANPAQSNSTVSQQYTVKNFEVSFTIETPNIEAGNRIERVVLYIMYIPQGYNVDASLPANHPEWIMAYKFVGSIDIENQYLADGTAVPTPPRRNAFRIRSRLSRRLQTGDGVVMLITGVNTNSQPISGEINGLLRWWTKAN